MKPLDAHVELPKIHPFRPAIINSVGDYRFCKHLRAYLSQMDARCPLTAEEKAVRSGYPNVEEWKKHRQEWWAFQEDIPLAYLGALGINQDRLLGILNLDLDAFEAARPMPLHPTHFLIRWMATLYQNKLLPEGCTLEQAIEILHAFVARHRLLACINFGDLKTHYFEPDHPTGSTMRVLWYVPGLAFTETHMVPNRDGTRNGTVSIGGVRI